MTLSKVRKPFLIDLSWQPYSDWLFVSTVSISSDYEAPSEYQTLGYIFTGYNTSSTDIGQVYVDNVEYTQTSSISSCKAMVKSWFYDVTAQQIYVHPAHTVRMDSSDFDSLETKGYCSGEGVFIDSSGFSYKPYLSTEMTISDEVDRSDLEKMSFVSNTLEFKNQVNYDGVGEFDYVITSPVPGADVSVYYISSDDLRDGKNSLTPIYTGYAESDELKRDSYFISVADKREQLNGKYPNVFYDEDDYTEMEDDLDELIPEGYGVINGLLATCTNDTIESGVVTYKYATDGTELTTVYAKDDDDEWQEVTPTVSDAEECTFTLSAVDGRDDSDNPRETKVDCILREETTPIEILADMLTRYLGYPFNGDYFDFSTWTDEQALVTGEIGFLMDERKEFFEWVEELQNSSTLPFLFRIKADGKFWCIADDITRAINSEYSYIENFNDDRNISTDFTQYATSVVISHSTDYEDEEAEELTVDTYYDETLDTYRLEQELEFSTLLNSEADAQIRGDNILKDYKKARPLHTVKLRGILSDVHLLSVITYDSSIYKNGVMFREYAGTVKLKVASYKFLFKEEMTIITGYDISDITSKGTEILTQGQANGPRANGNFANGSTLYYQPEVG